MTRHLETDNLSNQDISSALAIGTYTADADRSILCQFFADQVAGDGDYIFYLTLQIAGAGSEYVLVPKTTGAAAAGETAIGGQSIIVTVRNGDVVKAYLDGLAGDTTTPDTSVRWFELAALQSTTADRKLDVTAAGEAGIDWANVGSPTTSVGLTGTTVGLIANAISAAKIDANAIGSSELATNAIGADQIAENAIGASELATDAIGAAQIAANAIGASELAENAIGATQIAANAVGASEIADGAVDAGAIAANAITSAKIATDAIDAAALKADAVTEITTSVLTTAMTEAYASDGSAPTLAQALFAIQQFLQERSVSSTTLTVKKLDGSTGAMTFTLDDASAPTSITRAS